MVIGSGAGGGYDAYGRLLARHFGRFLPGNPKIVVENMPGSGGITAANWLYKIAPKDGTAFGIIQNSTAYEPLFGNQHASFDAMRFNWIGSLNRLADLALVSSASPFTSVNDLFEKKIIVGASTGGSDSVFLPPLLNRMIATKFKLVPGYTNENEVALAVTRGEVQGTLGISSDSLEGPLGSLLRDKQVRILMQIDLQKSTDPVLKNVPFVMDYVRNQEDRDVLKVLLAKLDQGRPFVAPLEMPPAIVDRYREAFMKMAADPKFLADAKMVGFGLPIDATPGSEVAQAISEAYKTPHTIVEKAIAYLNDASR